jgi:hypothetical protein
MLSVKVTERRSSECLLKTTKDLKKDVSCLVKVVRSRHGILLVGEGIRCLSETTSILACSQSNVQMYA